MAVIAQKIIQKPALHSTNFNKQMPSNEKDCSPMFIAKFISDCRRRGSVGACD
jgi:hypothetical protein